MARVVIEGVKQALVNINKALRKIEAAKLSGLMAAGLVIQRGAQKRTPVEYGNLRASAYTQKVSDDEVEVGYTAAYAPFVHENMEMKLKGEPRPSGLGRYWGPAGEPKFLQRSLEETDVAKIVAERVRKATR